MFREGSNLAIYILDNVAVEAAGLARKELHSAALSLRRDMLWKSFSSEASVSKYVTSPVQLERDYQAFIESVNVSAFSHVAGSRVVDKSDEMATLFGPDSVISDWSTCCLAMRQDDGYRPNWRFEAADSVTCLYYSSVEDLFWKIRFDPDGGKLLRIDLVEKSANISFEGRQLAIQKLCNFLLHFIWHGL